MDSISLSKRWTFVIAVVFTLTVFQMNTANSRNTLIPPKGPKELAQQALEKATERLDRVNSECREAKEKAQKEKSTAIVACKDNKKKAQEAKADNITASKEAINKCSAEFDKCLEAGKDELDTASITAGLSSFPGAESMAGILPGLFETNQRCSELNRSDYNAALKEAKSTLDLKEEKLEKLQEQTLKTQEEAQESYEKLQKEFVEAQEKKTKDDLEKKENDRNQQAAYEKQQAEYKAKADAINIEIFQAQQMMAIQLQTKGEEISEFNFDIEGCKDIAREKKAKQKQLGASSGLVAASGSSAKNFWNICVQKAIRKRRLATKNYESKMKMAEMNIQMKSRELQALEESSARLATMFQEAKADQENQKSQADQAFLEKQKQSWLAMQNRIQGMQNKNFKNQQLLSNVNRQINLASKEVDDLKGQKPLGAKSSEEIGQSLANFHTLIDAAEKICDIDYKEVKSAYDKAKQDYDSAK